MPSTTRGLAEQLAGQINAWLIDAQLPTGTPLTERALGERFRVSRSPVREALQLLAQRWVIEPRPEGGYAVAASVCAAPALTLPAVDDEEPTYLRIAQDRLDGRLPDRLAESELLRRYSTTRARLAPVLRRIVHEGWAERLPGHGWQFLPTLTSGAAYDQGYRLRILMEPAGILEPTWALDEAALRKCRVEQQTLVDGAAEWASPAQLFDANARLHETIASFSDNVFLADALKRVNRLRRLMEYRKVVDRNAAARRCREHLVLIDLLLTDQREAAADFMRLHLRDAAREKAGGVPPAPATAAGVHQTLGLLHAAPHGLT